MVREKRGVSNTCNIPQTWRIHRSRDERRERAKESRARDIFARRVCSLAPAAREREVDETFGLSTLFLALIG